MKLMYNKYSDSYPDQMLLGFDNKEVRCIDKQLFDKYKNNINKLYRKSELCTKDYGPTFIYNIKTNEDYTIDITYMTGEIRQYDIKPTFNRYPELKKIFNTVKIYDDFIYYEYKNITFDPICIYDYSTVKKNNKYKQTNDMKESL